MFIDTAGYKSLFPFRDNTLLLRSELYSALKFFREEGGELANEVIDGRGVWWVRDNGFHPDQIGFDIRSGGYSMISIYKRGFPIKDIDVQTLFPKTMSLLAEAHKADKFEINFAAFFLMNPGGVLHSHTHTRSHLIYHVLLNDLDGAGCEFECGNDRKFLKKEGDDLLFDYSLPHASKNHSSISRANFVLDFRVIR